MTDSPPPPPPPTHPNANQRIRCASCGYDLRGVAIGSACPECGTPVAQVGTPQLSSGKAVASLVLGIVSLVTCFMYGVPGIICGIIAVVFARKAEIAIQMGHAPVNSQGMARAGRICGWIGIGLGSAYFLFMAAMITIAILNP